MATGPTPWALILLGLCGCSDRFVDEAVCVLSVSLSGYITATMPEEINCGAMTGGIDLLFQPEASEHPIAGFDVAVPGVGRGQTGEFPARVIVLGAAGGVWETDACSVTIELHDDRGQVCYRGGHNDDSCEDFDTYRVRGHGECRTPARCPDGIPITVGPFEFEADVWWPR